MLNILFCVCFSIREISKTVKVDEKRVGNVNRNLKLTACRSDSNELTQSKCVKAKISE